MRGHSTGSLSRKYLHSAITEGLWYAVAEAESLREAKLAHAMMLASLYGNSSAKLDEGNDQVHEMYIDALYTLPYLKSVVRRRGGDNSELVEEWRRVNAEEAARKTESGVQEKEG